MDIKTLKVSIKKSLFDSEYNFTKFKVFFSSQKTSDILATIYKIFSGAKIKPN